jgi:hypothetical protein
LSTNQYQHIPYQFQDPHLQEMQAKRSLLKFQNIFQFDK